MKMRISILLFIALFVWGPSIWADDSQTIEVVVVKKDCLVNICKKFLEDPRKWRKIAIMNRLPNPDLIFPDQKLIFPVDLLRGTPIEGEVTFIKGNVMTQEKESGDWRALRLNERVGQGSGLKTGDEGTIEITYEDRAALLLRPNTTLKINKAASKGPSHFIRELYLRSGRTISKLKEATGRSSQFEIHSPSAIIATRGTVFRVWVDDQAETRSEVLKGVVGVEAMKQTVEVNEGEGTLVRANEAPHQPRKLLSAPGLIDAKSIYKTVPLKFRSGGIEGASSFRGMLSRDSDFKDVVYDQVVKPGEIIEIAGIDDGAYFLQIQSVDSDGLEGLPSAPLSVKVRVNPLPPYLQTPVEGAEYRGNKVEFKWLKVKDAVSYHLQVAEDREFSSLVIDKDTIKDTEYTATSLGVKTYFFRVSSIAVDDYEGAASENQTCVMG